MDNQQITKVYIGGSYCLTCQCDRISLAMSKLPNVEITDKSWEADLVFVNNPWFDQYIKDKEEGKLKLGAKLILNVQDLPLFLLNYDLSKLYNQLIKADAITSISQYTRMIVYQTFGLDSKVIYNPVKDVSPEFRLSGNIPYPQFKALMVGRLNDPNKRARLGLESLYAAGIKDNEIVTCGPEATPFGHYAGSVSDTELNKLYNSVRYVVSPSMAEGQLLPPQEGVICGAIPIMCQDMSTLTEFFPREFGYFPSVDALARRIKSLEDNDIYRQKLSLHCIDLGKDLLKRVSKEAVANNIWNVYKELINK